MMKVNCCAQTPLAAGERAEYEQYDAMLVGPGTDAQAIGQGHQHASAGSQWPA